MRRRWRRIRLFLSIVWREGYDGSPMPWRQAWAVACAMYQHRTWGEMPEVQR